MVLDTSAAVGRLAVLWCRTGYRPQLLALAAGLGIVFGVSTIWLLRGDISDIDRWRALGYPGVFFFSWFGSVSILLPVPGLLAVCGAGSLELNVVTVALLSGVGETLGELSAYFVGFGGSGLVEKRSFYVKLSGWMRRRGTLVLFVVSAIPNPVFDVVGIAAGATRFPLGRFIAVVLVGKALKGLGVAYACSVGVQLLPWLN